MKEIQIGTNQPKKMIYTKNKRIGEVMKEWLLRSKENVFKDIKRKVFICTGYDSITDSTGIKAIFDTYEKAKNWYRENNYVENAEPEEWEVL